MPRKGEREHACEDTGVALSLPGGSTRVDQNHTVNDVKLRLWTLMEKCDFEGTYTRANVVWLAVMAIQQLQRAEVDR